MKPPLPNAHLAYNSTYEKRCQVFSLDTFVFEIIHHLLHFLFLGLAFEDILEYILSQEFGIGYDIVLK